MVGSAQLPANPVGDAHATELLELAERLSADLDRGLDDAEAGRRLAVAGSNTVPSRTRPGYALIALRQLA